MKNKAAVDVFQLERFVSAQDGVYQRVLTELRAGEKTSHWMWFIFPQIAGLGSSEMARRFAISSIEEARAYLAHPVLGTRLRECCALLVEASSKFKGCSIEEILGYPDDMKLKSSMTLFSRASEDNRVFLELLKMYFDGKADLQTLTLLRM